MPDTHLLTPLIPHLFIRTKYDPDRDRYRVQIVKSVRHGDLVRQKIVRHVGIVKKPNRTRTFTSTRLSHYPMSPEVVRRELNALQMSILWRPGTSDKYVMPSRATTEAKRIRVELEHCPFCPAQRTLVGTKSLGLSHPLFA